MWPVQLFGVIAFVPALIACVIENKVGKAILCVISFFGFLIFAFLSSIFVFPLYVGVHSFWLSFVLCALVFFIAMVLTWNPFNKKIRLTAVLSLSGAVVLLLAIFVVPAVYRSSVPVSREEVNLWRYSPFGDWWYVGDVLTHHDSQVERLNEESTLKLYGELPRLDGATALYPVYSAFVRATYPMPEPNLDIPEYYAPHNDFRRDDVEYRPIVACSRTAVAFENLIDGYVDIIFLMGVSDEQHQMAKERGLELTLTPIGREAFVFFVNSRNRVSNLSTDDIRRIYSGEATNWQEFGGRNNAIRAYQRPAESGSQTMLKQIMGDTPLAPALLDETLDTMMMMYVQVASYRNFRNSLGYSFLYYISDMIGENRVRFLSIDGIEPTSGNIASGAYPFANNFYAITVTGDGEFLNPERTDNINKLMEWVLSPQGQYLVDATGYVPINYR
jgi:phosphate transport system substrate-binding protein